MHTIYKAQHQKKRAYLLQAQASNGANLLDYFNFASGVEAGKLYIESSLFRRRGLIRRWSGGSASCWCRHHWHTHLRLHIHTSKAYLVLKQCDQLVHFNHIQFAK